MDLLNRYGSSVNGALIHANRLAFGRTEGYLCMTLKSWQPACRQSCLETPCVARRQNIKHNTYPTMMKKLKYSPSSSDGSRSVSYRSRINPAWFPYRFRILSVLFPLLEARMIEQRKKEERRKNEGRYGNNTETMRDWYGNNRRNKEETREEEGRKEGQEKANGQSVHWHSSTWLAIVLRRKPFTEMAETEQNKLFRLVPLTHFHMEA